MNGLEFNAAGLPRFDRKTLFSVTAVLLTGAVLVSAAILHLTGKKLGIRLASDDFDLRVYFSSTRWIIDGGRLYREVPFEYPLFANLIFATL